jgi:hypothetical protein
MTLSSRALDALDRVLRQKAEADEILRLTVQALLEDPTISWAGIAFVENEETTLGPSAGVADESRRERVPIVYRGTKVGELWIDGDADRGLLERIAFLIAEYVLIGWDTRGEAWEP